MNFPSKSCIVFLCAVNSVQSRLYAEMCSENRKNKRVQGKIVNGDNGNLEEFVEATCYDYDETAALTGNAQFNKYPVKSLANGNFTVKYCDLGTSTPWSGWDFSFWNKKSRNPDIFCEFSRGKDFMKVTSDIKWNYEDDILDLGNITVYPQRYSYLESSDSDGYCQMDGPSGTVLGQNFVSGDFYKTVFSPACHNFDCCYDSSRGNKAIVAKCVKEFQAVTESICNARLSKLNWSFDRCGAKANEMHNDLDMKYLHDVNVTESEEMYNDTAEFEHSSHCKGNDWD